MLVTCHVLCFNNLFVLFSSSQTQLNPHKDTERWVSISSNYQSFKVSSVFSTDEKCLLVFVWFDLFCSALHTFSVADWNTSPPVITNLHFPFQRKKSTQYYYTVNWTNTCLMVSISIILLPPKSYKIMQTIFEEGTTKIFMKDIKRLDA